MADLESETAHKLLNSFMQFRKMNWHQKKIIGYKPSEIKLLFAIKKGLTTSNADMKVSEISKILKVTAPTVTQLINDLEKDDLVTRMTDPSDRRVVRIKLTEKGLIITEKAKEAFFQSFSGLIDYLGEEESNQLADLLSKVFLYFNQLN